MTDELVALATVEAAARTARALVAGWRELDEIGHPLNELQMIGLLKLALLEHDGFERSLEESLTVVDHLKAEAAQQSPAPEPERLCPAVFDTVRCDLPRDHAGRHHFDMRGRPPMPIRRLFPGLDPRAAPSERSQ